MFSLPETELHGNVPLPLPFTLRGNGHGNPHYRNGSHRGPQAVPWNLSPIGQGQALAIMLAIVEQEGRSDEDAKSYYSRVVSRQEMPDSVGKLPLDLEIPLPDLIDRRVDHKL